MVSSYSRVNNALVISKNKHLFVHLHHGKKEFNRSILPGIVMKSSWRKYIIGYFLIVAFLFNGIVPDIMILSGELTGKTVCKTMAEQENANTERSTEESKGEPRIENPSDAQSSFFIHPAHLFFVSINIIPRDMAFIQGIVIPVPTPPPDVIVV